MFQASLCPSSGDRLYKTASGVSLDLLAAVVWSQDRSWAHCALSSCPDSTQSAASTSRLTPDAVLTVCLLTMGIMMSETCWVNLMWVNIYTFVICWFFLLLRQISCRRKANHCARKLDLRQCKTVKVIRLFLGYIAGTYIRSENYYTWSLYENLTLLWAD